MLHCFASEQHTHGAIETEKERTNEKNAIVYNLLITDYVGTKKTWQIPAMSIFFFINFINFVSFFFNFFWLEWGTNERRGNLLKNACHRCC